MPFSKEIDAGNNIDRGTTAINAINPPTIDNLYIQSPLSIVLLMGVMIMKKSEDAPPIFTEPFVMFIERRARF